MTGFYEVSISAENSQQADTILNNLLTEKLVTGGQMLHAPARFLWKGELTDMNYVVIKSFTSESNKTRIIEIVKETSIEEVPMIWFTEIEGNQELTDWISKTLS
jgi:uncharacterized protein involved in tolerance to divalent cations